MKNVYDFSLMPFTRIIPKTPFKGIKEKIDILSSEVWYSDLLTIKNQDRPCGTYHIRSTNMFEDITLLKSLNLHFEPLQKVKSVGGFAHKFYDPKPGEPYDVYGVICKDEKHGLQWKEAHQSKPTDHETIGELLGYPSCCVEFFNEVWGKTSIDPIWECALNSEHEKIDDTTVKVSPLSPETNIIPRYFGIRATPHILHSMNCEESKEFSEMFLQYIPHKNALMELLKMSYTWNCYKGVAMISNKMFVGITNSMPFKERHIVHVGEQK